MFFLLSAFLRHFFLCRDRLSGDVPAHLAQPCCVALGWVLDLGLVSRLVFEGFVNWVPLPRLGPAVDRDGVTAYEQITLYEVQSHRIQSEIQTWDLSLSRHPLCQLSYGASVKRKFFAGKIFSI